MMLKQFWHNLSNPTAGSPATAGGAGLAQLLKKGGAWLGRRVYASNASIWFIRDLDEPLPQLQETIPVRSEFLLDDKQRLINWLQANHARYPWIYFPAEISSALANRHLFAVFDYQREIIGYVKLGVNRVYIHDFCRSLQLPADAAMVYDTFVCPDFRGRRLAAVFLVQSLRCLQTHGVRRVYCHIEAWNQPSLRAFAAVGFRPLGTMRFVRVAGLKLFWGLGKMLLKGPEAVFDRPVRPDSIGIRNKNTEGGALPAGS